MAQKIKCVVGRIEAIFTLRVANTNNAYDPARDSERAVTIALIGHRATEVIGSQSVVDGLAVGRAELGWRIKLFAIIGLEGDKNFVTQKRTQVAYADVEALVGGFGGGEVVR